MVHETNNMNNLEVKKVDFDLETYLIEHITDSKLANEIRNADIVLLPYNNFREIKGPIFPESSVEFYDYLTTNLNKNKVELCVEEEEYREIALHDEMFNLGIILLNGLLLPVISGLIVHYIVSRRGERQVNVKVTFIQKEKDCYKEFKYEGDSRYLVDTVETYMKKRDSNEN